MSIIFKRVNEIKAEERHSFAVADDVYDILIGDYCMPYASDGSMPPVIMIPTGKIAKFLVLIGAIKKEDVPVYYHSYIENNWDNLDADKLAGWEYEDDDISMIIEDFQYAAGERDDVVYYYVS